MKNYKQERFGRMQRRAEEVPVAEFVALALDVAAAH